MKFTVARERITNGLQAVQNIVGSRTTLPILSNVLLRGEGKRLELTATDLDVTVMCVIEANVARAGATTLPVRMLFSIVREVSALELEFEVDERNLCTITAGGSFFKMHGLAAEDFPPLQTLPEQPRLTLPQKKVKDMLRKTAFAASADEARYVLNGLFFSIKDHKIIMVATDGRRLALTEEELDIGVDAQADFIVPTKAIAELSRLLIEEGEVTMTFTESQVAFELRAENTMDVLVVSKLVDGTYPNYRQVIPVESRERVAFPREELLQALRRAQIMTSDKSNSVKLHFQRDGLAITANTPEVGEARESLAINYKGKEFPVAFNPGFLLDALNALDNDEVFLELTDELSPGVLKVNGPFLYVIMPMRTN